MSFMNTFLKVAFITGIRQIETKFFTLPHYPIASLLKKTIFAEVVII